MNFNADSPVELFSRLNKAEIVSVAPTTISRGSELSEKPVSDFLKGISSNFPSQRDSELSGKSDSLFSINSGENISPIPILGIPRYFVNEFENQIIPSFEEHSNLPPSTIYVRSSGHINLIDNGRFTGLKTETPKHLDNPLSNVLICFDNENYVGNQRFSINPSQEKEDSLILANGNQAKKLVWVHLNEQDELSLIGKYEPTQLPKIVTPGLIWNLAVIYKQNFQKLQSNSEDLENAIDLIKKAYALEEDDSESNDFFNYIRLLYLWFKNNLSDPKKFAPLVGDKITDVLLIGGYEISKHLIRKMREWRVRRRKKAYVLPTQDFTEDDLEKIQNFLIQVQRSRKAEISNWTKISIDKTWACLNYLKTIMAIEHEPGCFWKFTAVELPRSAKRTSKTKNVKFTI